MVVAERSSSNLEQLLENWRAGDSGAAERLLAHAYAQLQCKASRMLQGYPGVRRWDDTDDVWQAAAVKFHRSLGKAVPESLTHFFRLAAVQIRRTLIDLARKHGGPFGLGPNYDTGGREQATPDPTNDPVTLADWTEFHARVERLPEEEREVFDLL